MSMNQNKLLSEKSIATGCGPVKLRYYEELRQNL